VSALWRGPDGPCALGDAVDDAAGDIAEFAVLPLGGADQELGGRFAGAAAAVGHQYADGLVDRGPGLHGLVQVLGEVAGVLVHLRVDQDDDRLPGEDLGMAGA